MVLFGTYNVTRSPENENNVPVNLKKSLDPIVSRQKRR